MNDQAAAAAPRSRGETIFLAGLITVSLGLSAGLVAATIFGGYGFAPTFVALLLATFVATLAYTFLGGTNGAVFKLGGAQLAGSTAVIAAIFYLAQGPLAAEMRDARAIQRGTAAEALIAQAESEARAAEALRRQAEKRLAALQDKAGEAEASGTTQILTKIRASDAEQALGRGVIDIYRKGQGPFNRVIGTAALPVRFNKDVRPGTFRYCHGRRAEFSGRPVRFDIVDKEAGTSTTITLDPGEDIGQGVCSALQFEVLLGCDAVLTLLPTLVKGCDAAGGVAWLPSQSNRNYETVATILNPELTARSYGAATR